MADGKRMISQGEERGAIRISEDVISSISLSAANELEGVTASDNKKNVRISVTQEGVTIDLKLKVKYGVQILNVAKQVQESITESVTAMTGLKVLGVNIQIVGITQDEE